MKKGYDAPINLLRKKELKKKVRMSDATIWRLERDNKFPKRLQIGPNSVAWIEAEVDEWIENKAAQRA
jgi:prophage regulatory protein